MHVTEHINVIFAIVHERFSETDKPPNSCQNIHFNMLASTTYIITIHANA